MHSKVIFYEKKRFTLIELIIVVALITIITLVAFVVLKPTERFAQGRDSKRAADVASIAKAIRLYEVNEGQGLPAGFDDTLRMIGTAANGCNVDCVLGQGSQVQPDDAALVGSLELWLDATSIVGANDGDSLATWTDQSGNGRDAVQALAGRQPTYQVGEINQKPVIRFDGVDDHFYTDNTVYTARTVFVVFKMSSASQPVGELAQAWGSYAEGVQVSMDPRAGNVRGWSFDGNSNTTGRYGLNGSDFGGFAENSNVSQWAYDTFAYVAVEFNQNKNVTEYAVGSLFPAFAVGAHQFGGEIAEIIVYSDVLTDDEHDDIEGYLYTKYGLGAGGGQVAQTAEACYDIGAVMTKELPAVPFDPKDGSTERTQYAVKEFGNGGVQVVACGAELTVPIEILQ